MLPMLLICLHAFTSAHLRCLLTLTLCSGRRLPWKRELCSTLAHKQARHLAGVDRGVVGLHEALGALLGPDALLAGCVESAESSAL